MSQADGEFLENWRLTDQDKHKDTCTRTKCDSLVGARSGFTGFAFLSERNKGQRSSIDNVKLRLAVWPALKQPRTSDPGITKASTS